MWIAILILAGIASFAYGLSRGYYDGEGWGIGGVIAMLVGIVLGLGAWYSVAWEFPAEMAAAVEIRAATASLGCGASEDVLGKAADFNAKVARNRVENRRWLDDPFINDGIDTVTMIAIPSCK